MQPQFDLPHAWQSLGEALLIGLLVGIQREGIQAPRTAHLAGVRDFLLIAVTGAVCGMLQIPSLTIAALIGVTAILVAHAIHHPERAPGVTTELAAVATFALGFLTAYPPLPNGATLAIGAAIALVALLEAKKNLHRLVREQLTEAEFAATLRFLAIIFIIYPLLPEGEFGPHGFLSPRQVWIFVILVSSISYVGYFLQRFLGEHGINLTALLGGLASTTATTASLAKSVADAPAQMKTYSVAAVLANSVQMPRVLAVLYIMNPSLANAAAPALGSMMLFGLGCAWLLSRGSVDTHEAPSVVVGNPFRLAPALKFGALFAGVSLMSRWAASVFGGQGVQVAALVGGAVDVDAVSVAVITLFRAGSMNAQQCVFAVILGLVSNAVLKTGLAFAGGGASFGKRVAVGFAAMFVPGILLALYLPL